MVEIIALNAIRNSIYWDLDNVYFRPASDIQICLLILKKAVSNFSKFGKQNDLFWKYYK